MELASPQSLDHWMADKYRAQPGLVIELGLERKDAEHEIEKTRHLFNSTAVPRPNLRADVVNYFSFCRSPSQGTSEAQVEAGIIDQYDCVGFVLLNFVKRFAKLLAKITVLLDHFPQTKDSRVTDPIFELGAGDRPHLRTAAPDEIKIDIQLAQG